MLWVARVLNVRLPPAHGGSCATSFESMTVHEYKIGFIHRRDQNY